MIHILDEEKLLFYCKKLAKSDSDLALIFHAYGLPPLWRRETCFATLVQIILEQQVSVASAKACFDKLCLKLKNVTPKNFLALDDAELKVVGFSRQKISYTRNLAEAILQKRLNLKQLENLPDEEVKHELVKIKGIGDWTADIYLLMAMRRLDVMPKGDLALHVAWKKLKNLEHAPNAEEFLKIAERWKPFRAVAARFLWHFYLSQKRNLRKKSF